MGIEHAVLRSFVLLSYCMCLFTPRSGVQSRRGA
jgi:hypothetical protein